MPKKFQLPTSPITPTVADAANPASSGEWRDKLIPVIRRKLEDVNGRLGAAVDACGIAELSLALGHDGAAENAAECREAQRRLEIERDGLQRAVARAEAELTGAEERETAEEHARRKDRAVKLVNARVALAARLDAILVHAGAIADELEISARQLAAYSDVTRVSSNRMNLTSSFGSAFFAQAPALARALGLGRDKPLPRMQPLAVTEAAHWSLFNPVEIPDVTVTLDGETAAEPSANLADPLLGQYGGIVLEPMTTGGTTFAEGAYLPPELCLSWRLVNRRALATTGRVKFLREPRLAETAATGANIESLLA